MAQQDASNWAFTCKSCGHRYRWKGAMLPVPRCPRCHPERSTVPDAIVRRDDEVAEAVELCDEIQSLCNEIPEAGSDFASSVEDRMSDIRATIEKSNRVSARQFAALENMRDGLARWFHD